MRYHVDTHELLDKRIDGHACETTSPGRKILSYKDTSGHLDTKLN